MKHFKEFMASKLHEDMAAISSDLGMAMIAWKYIEWDLFTLFRHTVSPNQQPKAFVLWHSIYGITKQYQALNAVCEIEYRHDENLRKRWQALSGRVNRAIQQRNDLSHFSVTSSLEDFALIPNLTDPRNWNESEFLGLKKAYNPKRVHSIAMAWTSLMVDFSAFLFDIGARERLSGEALQEIQSAIRVLEWSPKSMVQKLLKSTLGFFSRRRSSRL